jgi:hypothetical protein
LKKETALRALKNISRPVLGPLWAYARRSARRLRSFDVPVEKLLRGGENEFRAARYAELTGDLLRPSTPAVRGPHVAFLREYERIGENVLEPDAFEKSAYYKNAAECIRHTGSYFVDDASHIRQVAERFIREYTKARPSRTALTEPLWVRPIRHSSCFEVMDGNHRFARLVLAGQRTVPVWLYEKEPALTPLQTLLLDAPKAGKSKRLHQPLDYPELSESWTLPPRFADRFSVMADFLSKTGVLQNPTRTYLDVGSRYGWFVKRFEELGFHATGVEEDSASRSVGFHCYGIRPEQIRMESIRRLMERDPKAYDVVSLLSVPPQAELGDAALSAEELIRSVDKLTARVLFLRATDANEEGVAGGVSKWTAPFFMEWLKKHTSFARVISVGKEGELFACVRE